MVYLSLPKNKDDNFRKIDVNIFLLTLYHNHNQIEYLLICNYRIEVQHYIKQKNAIHNILFAYSLC